jgi:hypothetical protein
MPARPLGGRNVVMQGNADERMSKGQRPVTIGEHSGQLRLDKRLYQLGRGPARQRGQLAHGELVAEHGGGGQPERRIAARRNPQCVEEGPEGGVVQRLHPRTPADRQAVLPPVRHRGLD